MDEGSERWTDDMLIIQQSNIQLKKLNTPAGLEEIACIC